MSDYCDMEVTCRTQDRKRFEALGFEVQDWNQPEPGSGLTVLVDSEARSAHFGEMPADIPFHGFNGSGGDYGESVFACDGKTYAEMESGHDGGFVVEWDEAKGQPSIRSLGAIRRYLRVCDRVQKMFARLEKSNRKA